MQRENERKMRVAMELRTCQAVAAIARQQAKAAEDRIAALCDDTRHDPSPDAEAER